MRVPGKKHYVSDLSKRDTLLHKSAQRGPSGTKVPRLYMCRSVISISKTTPKMLCDHPFSQRNKATKRTVGWSLKARGWVGWRVGQNLKNEE